MLLITPLGHEEYPAQEEKVSTPCTRSTRPEGPKNNKPTKPAK